MHPLALQRVDRKQRAKLSQPLVGTSRQVQAGRIGPVDDVDVVVARHHQDPLGEPRIRAQRIVEFGPFGGAAGIRHVAGDEDEIDGFGPVDGIEPGQDALEPLVALWPGATAFNAESVSFAHHMQVREMRYPKAPAGWRRRCELADVVRVARPGVGQAPDQRGEGQIGGNEHRAIGDRGHDEPARRRDIDRSRDEPCAWPGDEHGHRGEREQQDAGACRSEGPEPRPRHAARLRHQRLAQLADDLAEHDVDRLDDDGVERPEALLRQPEQAKAAEPADGQGNKQQQQGPHVENGGRKGPRYQLQPDGYHQRGDSQEKSGHENQRCRHHQQARQADLDKEGSGHADERARLGARGIILDVARVRIDHRHCRVRPVLHPWPAVMLIARAPTGRRSGPLPPLPGTGPWPCSRIPSARSRARCRRPRRLLPGRTSCRP